MEIDERTGLPKVPKGYYYKITRFTAPGWDVRVALKQRLFGFIPVTRASRLADIPGSGRWGYGIGEIEWVAKELYNSVIARKEREREMKEVRRAAEAKVDAYIGVYPPKNLREVRDGLRG